MAMTEEEKLQNELAEKFNEKMTAMKKITRKNLSEEQIEFHKALSFSWSVRADSHPYITEMMDKLFSGEYEKPSEFFTKKCSWVFGTYIHEKHRDAFLYSVDNVIKRQCSATYYRRSFRTADYTCYLSVISSIFNSFSKLPWIDAELTDILSLKLSEDAAAYAKQHDCYNEEMIAYELDKGNAALEEVITDIIMGEGDVTVNHEIIRGIILSRNAKMHELLGKLLLAARLQEGLRQAICENADYGSIEAFLYLLKVIDENDLIRFSSVKRAVGTWTGLLANDSSDLERISGKTLKLVRECAEDGAAREKYLRSEDSMEIYTALWAYGLFEIQTAAQKVKEISEKGTHHQLLTAGYFAANLEEVTSVNEIAKKVISEHNESDILAVYMPRLLKGWTGGYSVSYYANGRKISAAGVRFDKYFGSTEEAAALYDRLWEIYDTIPKKPLKFSPCIFPWYSAELRKGDISERLILTAFLLEDDEKLDRCCGMLKEVDAANRTILMAYVLRSPRTAVQRAVITEALGDKSEFTREQAFNIVKSIVLYDENYAQIEEMLKYKAADMRTNLIELLLNRSDDKVYGSIERLLSDKKEEKRTAALDMMMQLSKNTAKKQLFEKCLPLARTMANPSTKEKILLENIIGKDEKEQTPEPLFDEYLDRYAPEIPDSEYTRECVKTFMRYFPDSELGSIVYPEIYKSSFVKFVKNSIGAACTSAKETLDKIGSLAKLIFDHRTDEFKYNGEIYTIDCPDYLFAAVTETGVRTVPFMELWRSWVKINDISGEMLIRMLVMACAAIKDGTDRDHFANATEKYIIQLFGCGFEKFHGYDYASKIGEIIKELIKENVPENDRSMIAAAADLWYLKAVTDAEVLIPEIKHSGNSYYGGKGFHHLISHNQIKAVMGSVFDRNGENDAEKLALDHLTGEKSFKDERFRGERRLSLYTDHSCSFCCRYLLGGFVHGDISDYIYAAYKGIITEGQMYQVMFRAGVNLSDALRDLCEAAKFIREADRQVSTRGDRYYHVRNGKNWALARFIKQRAENENFTEEQTAFIRYADGIYDEVISEVLSVELKRGDTETEYSDSVSSISRIYGIDRFIAILSALGKDTLERSAYCYGKTKKMCLSHLLSVCIPEPTDNADMLREKLKGTDITEKRLIEAAMYSPEWLPIVGEYLGWEGFTSACYYFIAHMNEKFDDKRKAVIAKFTPLTEDELNSGAFDISWFRNAFDTLGQKCFDMIYDAAKYISDGAKHSRARKYADAALGKMGTEETRNTVADKRNKDLLMAYALIPIKDEDDICGRYLYLQQFLKESKKFGSQRSASEKKAVETAMQNLSINAGYADVTRLTLRMETKLIDDSRELFEEKDIDGTLFRLSVDDSGKAEIICTKGGKALKSVPAKLKKNEYVVRLSETKKKLTEQYRRTKAMFEQAMEESTEFTVSELNILRGNPVALPVIKDLVFVCGEKIGFLDGNTITDYAGNAVTLSDDDRVTVAHAYALYNDGHWSEYQKKLFDNNLVQPFRQVFRELYVKTAEESEMTHSLRYSGNQIQPAKTAACLKSRRWVADVEDGLQKVYYKENIVARIYAMADWFSPADIEAPTLEWVEFTHRKTGQPIVIKDIPDIIFSEVMRDVDMAVSVAHAGGVDPETSHSTVEMRAALISFTLPLFKLTNVEIKGNHAHIKGKYGEYTVHLGSGVIHKQGGTMINILPVHGSHRGKLFLPFADEDPKTAEIITKILFLAEDGKIKDPSILAQIR